MAITSRFVTILAAVLLSMTSNSLSADAFAAAVPGNAASPHVTASANQGAASSSSDSHDQEQSTVPLLGASTSDDPSIPRIQLGETISFDHMGPVIINSDGTTRTIDNWKELSPQEQQTAWRRIAKRNEQRRAALLQQEQEHAATGAKDEPSATTNGEL